jgi:hypothetical protein
MRAVLASVGFSSKTHSGILSEFRRRYIKQGIFPKEFSDLIGDAFDVRNDSDYNDFYLISKEEVTHEKSYHQHHSCPRAHLRACPCRNSRKRDGVHGATHARLDSIQYGQRDYVHQNRQ